MVAGLAFVATAIATLFAQATAVRWSRTRAPHQGAWTFALALFALASAALATGASTQWDDGTFRAFYLLGAVLNVPWLALGTVYLLFGATVGRRAQWGLVLFTGFAAGGSSVAAIVIVGGAVWSAARFARRRDEHSGERAEHVLADGDRVGREP